mgnify:CR=1 FL=1
MERGIWSAHPHSDTLTYIQTNHMDPLFLDVLKKEVVDVLRQDIGVLRQDMDVMHQDIREMRQDITQVRTDIAAVDTKLEHHIVATSARFDGVDKRFDGVDQRFDGVDERFNSVDQRFDGVDQQFDGVDQQFDGVDQRFNSVDEQLREAREMTQDLASHVDTQLKEIRAEMATKADLQRFVTKDYLDDKLADLRSDLIMMARKGNKKLEAFVEELVSEKRLPRAAARRILLLEPFPVA